MADKAQAYMINLSVLIQVMMAHAERVFEVVRGCSPEFIYETEQFSVTIKDKKYEVDDEKKV